ncbi:extracellular solute-binding protein [Alisedimentitalea sp. MJ-SS2]|uniref:ABC transporter substrate-binding protein n=1 Tax=Aliisedimentitalea sp. MJ-SS2 TaxID=3049795 RepID=UPI00290C4706|nr:extracellular solute-binding protein [Alisedimentitalea sp. MJ-SS2]MDU8929952.1 extracellular solute-binding protein [Alisedimentitalea sp. MJ-SS2]
MKHTSIGAVALLATFAGSAAWAGGADLTVFDWSGYEDQGFFGDYMAKYNEAPSYTFFGSQEEAFTKLQSGFTADLAHPCTDAVRKWVAADLLVPLDTSKLKNWDAMLPEIKEVDGVMIDGTAWMMPFEWGNTGLIYRTDKVSDDKISLQLMADPAYQGKVSLPDAASSAYAMASLATGNGADYTKLSDEQFKAASDFLRAVHPNVRFYWADAGQMDQAMASGELELGWAWNQSELNLIWNETPAKMMRDVDKGIATWACGYVHLKSSTTPVEQIYDHLNALSEAASGKYIIDSWGYPHANAEAFKIADQALIKQYGFDDPKSFFEGSLFFDAVEPALEAKMLKEFERIKAGF